MRWLVFGLTLIGVLVIQTSVLPVLALDGLDLFLVLAIVWSLSAPVHDARLAAWTAGLAQDLASSGPLGVFAFALGLAGLIVTILRSAVNVYAWWGRLLVAFIAAWPAALIAAAHARYWEGRGSEPLWMLPGNAAGAALLAALLTTLVTTLPNLLTQRAERVTRGRTLQGRRA
ncbi:MAG: rod shape-determining protein MreD [Phycisphaerae bacterium]|nr:rod shape-determining protein MreD [Phycisphaerae bacterium]MCZ2400782.1 rod shape-determining protein MreD [Phycisphaerae bacterium]NUQ49429.1 rod shape-determining protein MreD [Phycisphaerae bacterium]